VLTKKFFGRSALPTNKLALAQLTIQKKIITIPRTEFSWFKILFWLTKRYIPINPKNTPSRDVGEIFFPWNILISKSTIKGCEEISKAAKLVSTYLNAHTTTPFPKLKNKNPAMAVLTACFFVIAIDLP